LSPQILINSLSLLDFSTTPISREGLLTLDYILAEGSSYIVPNGVVKWFEKKWQKELEYYHSLSLIDDDQSLLYFIITDYPEMFQVIHDIQWFSLFKSYVNEEIESSLVSREGISHNLKR
jgi:hypothetical protein